MKISMIAAIGRNRELGEGNKLIWNIPSDLQRFRDITRGHPVIMGRKTHESIGRLLPDRANIIVTQNSKLLPRRQAGKTQNCLIANSIEQAIELAKNSPGSEEVFIIGGAQIYALGMPYADYLYLTKIDAENPNADAFFPDYSDFKKVVSRETREENGLKFEYVDLEKE